LWYVIPNNFFISKSNIDADVIHGDIKPQNVLVFKDATGTTVKVADFGYSTLAAGESGKVLLPKSRPWNAPEHHFGEFDVFEAKKTDVYSFGLLCLWVLLAHSLPDIPQTTAEGATELISFDASHSPCTVLEQLKNEDKLEAIANQYMETVPMADLNAEQRIHLKQFFSSTITFDPKKRTSDLGRLMVIIRQAR
jgi:serine/threonine protein kinase